MKLNSKLVFFAFLFMILVASSALADGLKITELDVHVDYDEAYTYRVENRDRIDSTTVPILNGSKIDVDILPGSTVRFTIRVENTFGGEDPKLKGVFTRVTIEDIDDESDLDYESLDFDLEPGDDYRFDVEFKIPIDADAGTYNVLIEAESEDRNETSYDTEANFKLEVKKQSHDIRIVKAFLNPSIVDCSRKTKLTAEIANLGSNHENELAFEFKVPNLGINSYEKDISLQSSSEASEDEKTYTKTISIEVPSFFTAGTYPVYVNLYWKNFVLFDKKELELVVRNCGPGPSPNQNETTEENGEVTVDGPDQTEENATSAGEDFTTVEGNSFFSSPLNIAAVSGGIAIFILAILFVIGYLNTPRH